MLQARKSLTLLLLICLFITAWTIPADSQSTQSLPQRNLAAFFNKLRAGKTVTVAYMGSSITSGIGASDPERTAWRPLVTKWLRDRYPQATINALNAAVSGTGSAYGAMRARRDVIAHKPDLVFIEFAVSDWHESEKSARESIEGIIRQLLIQPQPPEIALIFAPTASGKTRASLHQEIAEYYRLPLVNLTPATMKFIEQEEIEPEAFWKDGVHPFDQGQQLYARLITSFLLEQEKLSASLRIFDLPVFLEANALTYGEIRPFVEFITAQHWKPESSSNPLLPARLLVGDKISAEFETTFEGSAVGLLYAAGPDCGIIECLIDGKPAPEPLTRIDGFARSGHLQTRVITSGLDAGSHQLKIRIVSEKNPKSSGHHFRLGSLLVGGQRPEKL